MATEVTETPDVTDGEVQVNTWMPLIGRWSSDGPSPQYLGSDDAQVTHPWGIAPTTPYGIARAADHFQDGEVSLRITLTQAKETSGGILIGFQSTDHPYIAIALGAFERAYSIFEWRPDFGWVLLRGIGEISNLSAVRTYQLTVRIEGQKVRMTVDGVQVLEIVVPSPMQGTGLCLFAYDKAPVTFEEVRLGRNRPKVFVAMPFQEPFDTLYREVIEPIAKGRGFKPDRVDNIAGPGIILDDIYRQIQGAHVIVAEISSQNPNVFYELGYAHALNKPAILLVHKDCIQNMPFDIRGYRAIPYDDTIGGKRTVEDALRKHLDALRRDF